MRLIHSRSAIDFLSQAAPRVWVKRMLFAMIHRGEITAFFNGGKIVSQVPVYALLGHYPDEKSREHTQARDKWLRENYDDEIADKCAGKGPLETIIEFDKPLSSNNEYVQIGAGFFDFAMILDWDAGTLFCDVLPERGDRSEFLFSESDEELLNSYSGYADISVNLTGLSFLFDHIEILLPSHPLLDNWIDADTASERKPIGRPRKWDWEGAMGFVAADPATAQIPAGAGAQARIEDRLAQWFIDQTGDAPAVSQIRPRASRLVGIVGKSEKGD